MLKIENPIRKKQKSTLPSCASESSQRSTVAVLVSARVLKKLSKCMRSTQNPSWEYLCLSCFVSSPHFIYCSPFELIHKTNKLRDMLVIINILMFLFFRHRITKKKFAATETPFKRKSRPEGRNKKMNARKSKWSPASMQERCWSAMFPTAFNHENTIHCLYDIHSSFHATLYSSHNNNFPSNDFSFPLLLSLLLLQPPPQLSRRRKRTTRIQKT